jgi:hypothetical protein
VEIRAGKLTLRELQIAFDAPHANVTVAGRRVKVTPTSSDGGTLLRFPRPITLKAGQALTMEARR